ncbi:MAG: ATP-binding protein [Chloroflexi bacterium]|nr:ATP-binding protein [Chloroflexota bacterium]MCY3587603.1 ATP-binding protein [Chloroflexota bacterium]MCY3685748.1 ATP-binding protein [Chloroflexota bacterium]MDE2708031.1 ATP-binding protein [Chloroflexota bacterium]
MLCLDELDYVCLDSRCAELLFQTLTERAERASIAIASNASFSEWCQILDHPWSAAADRFTLRFHIFETGSDSHCARPEVNRSPDFDRKVWPATMIKPKRNHIIVLTRALRARPLRPHALRRAQTR